ncbi:hypothetical protein B7486_61880, partial [cyanobacterium TDX16]
NTDGNRDVVLWDAETGTFSNMSTTVGGGDDANRLGDISNDGAVVVYSSNQNPFGQNADANQELFTRVVGGSRDQLTQTTGGTLDLIAADADASVIAFRSNRNLTGENADGSDELFRTDLTGSTFDQLTSGSGSVGPRHAIELDADGSTVAFGSNADPVGQNPDGDSQLFVMQVGSGSVEQVLQGTSSLSSVGISASGDRVTLRLPADPLGTNGDGGNESFLVDLASDEVTQVTDGGTFGLSAAALAGDGRRLLGASNVSGATDLVEVSCGASTPTFTDVGTAHPFFDEIEWMVAADVSEGFLPGPTYKPGAAVSRQAMSAFMYRLAGEPD